MTQLLNWSIAHGVELGCGMLALALFIIVWLIVDLFRDRRDDGFQPIGQPVPDVRRHYAPYDRGGTRNRVTSTLVQPPLT